MSTLPEKLTAACSDKPKPRKIGAFFVKAYDLKPSLISGSPFLSTVIAVIYIIQNYVRKI